MPGRRRAPGVRDNTLGGNGHGGIVVADTPRGRSAGVVIDGNSLRGDDIRGCSETVVCADND